MICLHRCSARVHPHALRCSRCRVVASHADPKRGPDADLAKSLPALTTLANEKAAPVWVADRSLPPKPQGPLVSRQVERKREDQDGLLQRLASMICMRRGFYCNPAPPGMPITSYASCLPTSLPNPAKYAAHSKKTPLPPENSLEPPHCLARAAF